ncbi:thioredoxin family protein [Thiohalomonas denitrificans]|uniref:thioredoxin family protein n=1 Tax=Thiohalomonas denitrificans TaxID=415747 RepID=UPI0026F2F59D|nr:thioredoxin family protein [Thiohalomonas denitrificans]
MHFLTSSQQFDAFIEANPAVLIYFSSPGCGVCNALKPRVRAMVEEEFPELMLAEVDCEASPELAAQHGVFAVPTVTVWFEQHEITRKSRAFSVGELQMEMERPYAMMFEA